MIFNCNQLHARSTGCRAKLCCQQCRPEKGLLSGMLREKNTRTAPLLSFTMLPGSEGVKVKDDTKSFQLSSTFRRYSLGIMLHIFNQIYCKK